MKTTNSFTKNQISLYFKVPEAQMLIINVKYAALILNLDCTFKRFKA